MNELHRVLGGSGTCQEMGTKQLSPSFPFFVSFRAHLKPTLKVGRTGWVDTEWMKRKLEAEVVVAKVMAGGDGGVHKTPPCCCVRIFCMIVRTAVVLS